MEAPKLGAQQGSQPEGGRAWDSAVLAPLWGDHHSRMPQEGAKGSRQFNNNLNSSKTFGGKFPTLRGDKWQELDEPLLLKN